MGHGFLPANGHRVEVPPHSPDSQSLIRGFKTKSPEAGSKAKDTKQIRFLESASDDLF